MNIRRAVSLVLCLTVVVMLQACGSNPAGTYVLDKEAIKVAARAEMEKSDDEAGQIGGEMALGMIDAMNMTITLNADGTAEGSISMMGQTDKATGTWTLDGDKISVTMAGEGESPQTMSGTWNGDTIELSDGEQPYPIVLKKSG